jgi:hypothetical protein
MTEASVSFAGNLTDEGAFCRLEAFSPYCGYSKLP